MKIFSFGLHYLTNVLGALYVKVTLFESLKVVRAKKTRPISILDQEHGEFKECFSILFPKAYIDQVKIFSKAYSLFSKFWFQVSCIISLCWKPKKGSKLVLGRTSIGPHWKSDNQGYAHWNEMKQFLGDTVSKWHLLIKD